MILNDAMLTPLLQIKAFVVGSFDRWDQYFSVGLGEIKTG